MLYNIPNVLLISAIVVPVALFAIASIRGKKIYQMSEVGLSALMLVILSVVTACIQSATAGYDAQQFMPSWIVGGVFAALTVVNAIQVIKMKDRFALETTISEEDLRSFDVGRNGHADVHTDGDGRVVTVRRACCASVIVEDTGLAADTVKESNPLKILALNIPLVTINFFRIEIAFSVASDRITVVAASSAKIRPWYSSFIPVLGFIPIIQREAKATAEARVMCKKRGEICVATSNGHPGDVSSENECQAAAAVDVAQLLEPDPEGDAKKPKVDPTQIQLIAKGVATFKGSGTLEDIKIAIKPTDAITLSTTINTPSAPDLKEDLKRPVTFECQPQLE